MSPSHPSRARTFWGWLRAWVVAVAAVVALWLAAPGVAQATEGRPAGWQTDRATQRVVIGRIDLRYEPTLSEEAQLIIEQSPRWWSEIEQALAGDLDDRLQITFVDHAGRVAEATGMPRWVAGVAHPPTGRIMIARHGPDGTRTDLENLLKHEMAHVALHRATDGAELPRWFHEGVAESFTGGISLTRAQTLASAVFGPGVPDLQRLEEGFHGVDGPQASVSYAAARDLVTHLRYRDGSGAHLRQVLSDLRHGHELEPAFVHAYGLSLRELVKEWRQGLPERFIWYALVAGGGLPFALVTPLVIVAWIRRRRLIRRGYARLEREDLLAQQRLLSAGYG